MNINRSPETHALTEVVEYFGCRGSGIQNAVYVWNFYKYHILQNNIQDVKSFLNSNMRSVNKKFKKSENTKKEFKRSVLHFHSECTSPLFQYGLSSVGGYGVFLNVDIDSSNIHLLVSKIRGRILNVKDNEVLKGLKECGHPSLLHHGILVGGLALVNHDDCALFGFRVSRGVVYLKELKRNIKISAGDELLVRYESEDFFFVKKEDDDELETESECDDENDLDYDE